MVVTIEVLGSIPGGIQKRSVAGNSQRRKIYNFILSFEKKVAQMYRIRLVDLWLVLLHSIHHVGNYIYKINLM